MQRGQPLSSVILCKPQPMHACSWSNISPALNCACHHQHNHAAGAISRQRCTANATTSTTMKLEQHLASYVLRMPPPTQLCSWINLSPTLDCACHHQHTHAAGATSQQLWTAHATPTQPSSWGILSSALDCTCHHQHNHAAGATSRHLWTAHATTNAIMQLEQPITNSGLHMLPPAQPCS